MTVGSSRPMEDSWRIGNAELVHWVGQLYGLHPMDAYQLCSQIAQAPIANVVDANYSVVVKAAKALLPAADAFGGIHADLRPGPARSARSDLSLNGHRAPPPLTERPAPWICSSAANASWSPAAPVASAGPSSRPSSTRARSSGSAPATPEEVRRPRRRCATAAGSPGRRSTSATATALAAWVEQSAEAFGGLDVVVANVSALAIPDTEENWQLSLNVDLMHTVRLVRAALPHLERSDAASIIAISSVSGRESDFASGPYGTAKTAIVGYIHGLALQLADKGIRANTVSPGNTYFEGGVWANIETGNPDLFEMAVGLNPTGHMGTPEEIAGPVVFLASPGPAGSAAPTSSSTAH